jgi:hypothetical protein
LSLYWIYYTIRVSTIVSKTFTQSLITNSVYTPSP